MLREEEIPVTSLRQVLSEIRVGRRAAAAAAAAGGDGGASPAAELIEWSPDVSADDDVTSGRSQWNATAYFNQQQQGEWHCSKLSTDVEEARETNS